MIYMYTYIVYEHAKRKKKKKAVMNWAVTFQKYNKA